MLGIWWSCAMTSFADEAIKSVTIAVTSSVEMGGSGSVSATADSTKYHVVSCEFINGKTSWNYYRKYQESATGIPAVSLPSTSPANAAWTLEKLEGAWGIITDYLK